MVLRFAEPVGGPKHHQRPGLDAAGVPGGIHSRLAERFEVQPPGDHGRSLFPESEYRQAGGEQPELGNRPGPIPRGLLKRSPLQQPQSH